MAKPVKQLRDLLQEKQEPFMLDLYLLDKGYLRKRFDSRNLLRSSDPERSQKGVLQCSKILRAVCSQIISFNEKLKIKNSNPRDGKTYGTPELESFSSATASTSTCTVSDGEETSTSQQKEHITLRVTEAVADRKLQCQCIEESRELSPVSVLEELPSNRDGASILSSILQKNDTVASTLSPTEMTEDSILSASLCQILFQSAREQSAITETQELVYSNSLRPNLISKKVLQQTRQLLFDCVGEIVETRETRRRKQQQTEYLAIDDFGKLIEEKIKSWGKQYGQEFNLAQLLEMDFRNSAREWIIYKPLAKRIGCEIGDAILEEILNETVINMVDF